MLTDIEIDRLEEDLIEVEKAIEECAINDTETLRDLSRRKEIILRRLNRRKPL